MYFLLEVEGIKKYYNIINIKYVVGQRKRRVLNFLWSCSLTEGFVCVC